MSIQKREAYGILGVALVVIVIIACAVLLGLIERTHEEIDIERITLLERTDALLLERTAERDQAHAINAELHKSLLQANQSVEGLLAQAVRDQDEIDRMAFLIEGYRAVQGDYE